MEIGIYTKFVKSNMLEHLGQLIEELQKHGLKYRIARSMFSNKEQAEAYQAEEDNYNYMREVDYVITLGGDGTILSAMTHIQDSERPILGINLGRLGFLTSAEENHISEAVASLVEKDYSISARSVLGLQADHDLFGDAPFALNDLTLQKRDTSAMITIHAYLNDQFLATYWADGLIVSTPTGSTGYSLSCGGPIVFPQSGNMIITPIAPHNLNVRPLIISDDAKLRFNVEGRSSSYLCSMDSRFEVVSNELEIRIQKAAFTCRIIQLENTDYLSTIRRKLQWAVDKRN